jgi:hypothetical protein
MSTTKRSETTQIRDRSTLNRNVGKWFAAYGFLAGNTAK